MYNTALDKIINCYVFDMNDINRFSATTIPEYFIFIFISHSILHEFYINVTVLNENELFQCRDGILSMSDDFFKKDDIEQLIASMYTS